MIDGNSFCYRAYYAIRHLSTSKGQPTNAIYGFITMLRKIIKDENPYMIAVAFDLKAPTFRHKKYNEYKIQRKPMPDDLVSQLPYIKKLVKAHNIPIYEMEGYEADDIIATLATKCAESDNVEVFIVTGDKDALQLVGSHIKVYNPLKDNMICTEKEVKDRFGVGPDKVTDVMALMGDSSDNIPGVPGIGEKTAIELIKKFGSLEYILENTDLITSASCRKKISDSREMAIMSKELATVDRNVPIEIDAGALVLREPDENALAEILKELEFKNLLKEVVPKKPMTGTYRMVDTKKGVAELVSSLCASWGFAFDFETTHYDPMKADPVGVSFCWREKEAYYVPFNALRDTTKDHVFKMLKPVFEDGRVKKIGQNIKYDMLILKNAGIGVNGIEFDTMVASYLLDPSKSRHNLSDISTEHLERATTPIEDLIGKGVKAITMDKVPVERVCDYCCEDSDAAFRLRGVLEKKLKDRGLYSLFSEVEMPLVEILADMESCGVSIDVGYLKELSRDMQKSIKKLEKNIYRLAGEEFNINSSKQLQKILFDKLKMPVIKRTKTGASTNEEVLNTLAEKEELPKEILGYRELAKLKSTYVDSLPGLINQRTGRIHTSFNQTVTATGRLSSSNPNLQNIPIKTDMGKKIRKAFVAGKKNHVLLSADYSQVELRMLAHLSCDKNLQRAFSEQKDIHTFTASLVHSVDEKDVTPEMRAQAKTVNFGIIYGMSSYGLSRDLGIDVREASGFIDSYFERYSGVKEYLEKTIEGAREKGFVTTILGRRRYIPEINSANNSVRNFAERTAVNAPIQGSAADLIKLAMIKIHKELPDLGAMMILQVHDELVFETDKKSVRKLAAAVKKAMENVMELKVPIVTSLEVGDNWLELDEVRL